MSGTVDRFACDAVAFYSGAGWWVLPNRVRWFSYGRKLSGALVGRVWLLLGSQCTRLAFRLLPRSLGCCTHVRSSWAGSYAWAIWPTDLLELLKSGGFPTVGKPVEEDLSNLEIRVYHKWQGMSNWDVGWEMVVRGSVWCWEVFVSKCGYLWLYCRRVSDWFV